MIDPTGSGVGEKAWREAVKHCHELRVARCVAETHDSMSIVLEIPAHLKQTFAYRAGQFLSFKVPHEGSVLTRSYSLASSPDVDAEHKVTVKRVDDGRISNWMNDQVVPGETLMVVPPAGLFVLDAESTRDLMLFSGGSGITPCISIVKTALATTSRPCVLIYANRDERSIIFREELEALRRQYPDRLEIIHSLDDVHGFLNAEAVVEHVGGMLDRDFYLCGPAAFMETVEQALQSLRVDRARIHIEHFVSPPEHEGEDVAVEAPADRGEVAPAELTIVLDGQEHRVPYVAEEKILASARRAGLDPPFSCEEGYCSCCMAKLVSGKVVMAVNDSLTPDLLEEGWILTCQARCASEDVRVEYPD